MIDNSAKIYNGSNNITIKIVFVLFFCAPFQIYPSAIYILENIQFVKKTI